MLSVIKSLSLRNKLKHYDDYKHLLTTPESVREVFSNDKPEEIPVKVCKYNIQPLIDVFYNPNEVDCIFWICRNNNWVSYKKYVTSDNVETALIGASTDNHIDMVRDIWESYRSVISQMTIKTVIKELAKFSDNTEFLRNFVDENDAHQFYFAAISENGCDIPSFEWIMSSNASPYLNNYIHRIAKNNHINLVKYCYNRELTDKWEDATYLASRCGAIEVANFLLSKFPQYTNYCFIQACKGGHLQIIETMDKFQIEDWEKGILSSIYRGYTDVIQYLYGVEGVTFNRDFAFRIACYKGRTEIVELLLTKHIPKQIKEEGLEIACAQGHRGIVNILFELEHECGHCELMDHLIFPSSSIREECIFN